MWNTWRGYCVHEETMQRDPRTFYCKAAVLPTAPCRPFKVLVLVCQPTISGPPIWQNLLWRPCWSLLGERLRDFSAHLSPPPAFLNFIKSKPVSLSPQAAYAYRCRSLKITMSTDKNLLRFFFFQQSSFIHFSLCSVVFSPCRRSTPLSHPQLQRICVPGWPVDVG